MNSTLLIIICLAVVCFHLRKLSESVDNKKDSSTYSNNVKFRKAKKFVIKRKHYDK